MTVLEYTAEMFDENSQKPLDGTAAEPKDSQEESAEGTGALYFSGVEIPLADADDTSEIYAKPIAEIQECHIAGEPSEESAISDIQAPSEPINTERSESDDDIVDLENAVDSNFPPVSAPARRASKFRKTISDKKIIYKPEANSDEKTWILSIVSTVFTTILFAIQTVEAFNIFSHWGKVCETVEEFTIAGGTLLLNIALSIPTTAMFLLGNVLTVRLCLTSSRKSARMGKKFLVLLLLCLFYFLTVLAYYIVFFVKAG